MGNAGASGKYGLGPVSGDTNLRLVFVAIALVIFIAASIVAVFNLADSGYSNVKIVNQQDERSTTTTLRPSLGEELLQRFSKLTGKGCGEFGKYIAECENSVRLALGKYPGNVSVVERVESGARIGNETLWLVGINLDNRLRIGDKGDATEIKAMVTVDGSIGLYEVLLWG